MNRQGKMAVVESLHNDFSQSKAAFVVGFQGLTVAQMKTLRTELRKQGGKFKVAKARLMKRAAQGIEGAQDLTPVLHNQIGLVFATKEAPAVAKVLQDFSKENEALKLIGGCMDTMVLDGNSVIRIASLPPKEVLLAQVCGTLKAPMAGLAGVLNAVTLKLLMTLKQVGEKKQ